LIWKAKKYKILTNFILAKPKLRQILTKKLKNVDLNSEKDTKKTNFGFKIKKN